MDEKDECESAYSDDEEEITQEDAWTVISAYFEDKGLVRQQLDSFDKFIMNTMHEIVDESDGVIISQKSQHNPGHQYDFQQVSFCQIYLSEPSITEPDGVTSTLFPRDAGLRNLTYSAPLYVDVTKQVTKKGHDGKEVIEPPKTISKVNIGKVPIMLRSSYCTLYQCSKKDLTELGECPCDQGGYFIINGSEKVLIAQEKMSTNHVYVFKRKQPNKYSYMAEVRSMVESQNRPPRSMFINLFFWASTKEVALDYIAKRGASPGASREKRIKYAKYILQKEMLPHVGVGEYYETKKAYYFGYIIQRLLPCALGRRPEDDRDHYGNKRLDLGGPLLGGLFRMLFRKLTRDVKTYGQKCVDSGKDVNLLFAINAKTITSGLKYALSTGNWGQANVAGIRAGVSQVLNHLTYAATLLHLRRLNSPIGHEGKVTKLRQLHNSQWGIMCPTETPEGQACGLVKNLALMVHITVGSAARSILDILKEKGTENFEEISPSIIQQATKIFVNGCWVGIHHDRELLVKTLRQLRRQVDISSEVGIACDIHLKELRLYIDYGRCSRPLFIVENQQLLIKKKDIRALCQRESPDEGTWHDLVAKGFIEYICTEEEETTMISMTINVKKKKLRRR